VASPCNPKAAPGYNPLTRLAESGRISVEGDYLVIEYNARTMTTAWIDYKDHGRNPRAIVENGAFLPVVYNRERIAVHVCDLRFADQLTVTTNPLALPEGGADIHGYIPTAPTALAPTLDALQSVANTGVAAPASGLGYSTTPTLTVATVPGYTAQSTSTDASGKTTTVPATINLDPGQVALQMYALVRNGMDLVDSVNQIPHGQRPFIETSAARITWSDDPVLANPGEPCTDERSRPQGPPGSLTPTAILSGSLDDVRAHAVLVCKHIMNHRKDAVEKLNPAAFDSDLTEVQNLAVALSNLAASVAANGFGTRAATLQNNYGILCGVLDSTGYGQGQNPNPVLQGFNDKYEAALNALAANSNGQVTLDQIKGWDPRSMFDALSQLKKQLRALDIISGTVFADINRWNEESSIEQTDLLTPAANNALMRISILVQHSYTPFTIINNPSATVTLPASVATGTSATTSTPPHAVKTILLEVHRLAQFNLVGGIVFFKIPNTTYAVTPGTNATPTSSGATTYTGTCGGTSGATSNQGTASTYSCVVPTQSSSIQLAGMAGLTYYPWRRDYFPRHSGNGVYRRNLYPSIIGATSVTSLGNSVVVANWEPLSGLDIFAGGGWAHQNVLPSGITTSTILPAGYTLQLGTKVKSGFAFGFGFDVGILSQIFGSKTSAASMP
jgi:hypothetical protein